MLDLEGGSGQMRVRPRLRAAVERMLRLEHPSYTAMPYILQLFPHEGDTYPVKQALKSVEWDNIRHLQPYRLNCGAVLQL